MRVVDGLSLEGLQAKGSYLLATQMISCFFVYCYRLVCCCLPRNSLISLLFDIDGTLLRAGNAGMKAVHETLVEMFGEVPESKLVVHGRTDHGIMTDVFASLEKDYQQYRVKFDRLYWEKLPRVMEECDGCLLPGVVELLEALAAAPDVALGVLTGNACVPANIKLKHFGIQDFFSFGGYGDDYSNRNQVAAVAMEAARAELQGAFDADQVWVIGDTVNDITCARSVGAKVIAVETGGGTHDELVLAAPDVVFADLSNVKEFLHVIGK